MHATISGNCEKSKPKLLTEVREVLRRKHYSLRTEEAYVDWIRRFILFQHKRHPREMGEGEVRAFLTYLAVVRGVAGATQNQALSALLFLYKEVLERPLEWIDGVERAQKPKRRPVVLSKEEVRAVLAGLTREYRLMAELLYGAGLRLMECLRLRVKDVDFGYLQITVRDGKGQKDRVTMLPVSLVPPLREASAAGPRAPSGRSRRRRRSRLAAGRAGAQVSAGAAGVGLAMGVSGGEAFARSALGGDSAASYAREESAERGGAGGARGGRGEAGELP
jgi:integrase